MSGKSGTMIVKPQRSEIMIVKMSLPAVESDAYGLKALFRKLNEWARCPKDKAFLVWKDEKKDTLLCEKCGFEKPAEPAPTWP